MRSIRLLILLTLFAFIEVEAQFAPVAANLRITEQTISNGSVVESTTKEGKYYRNTEGSTLKRWFKINGKDRLTGDVFDNRELVSYTLDYSAKKAVQSRGRREKVRPGSYYQIQKKLGQDVVSGISCIVVSVTVEGMGASPQTAGRSCVSPEYDLILRLEIDMPIGGNIRRSVTELSEVKVNVDPDPSLFEISKNFVVYKADSSAKQLP